MTAQSRATLKANFEDGDTPTGSNYADLIDSFVSLTDASAQTLSGPLVVSEAVISRTSGADANFTGAVSAASVFADSLTADDVTVSGLSVTTLAVPGTVSATTVFAEQLQASAAGLTNVSAGALIVGTSIRLNSPTTAAASTGTGESLPASVAGYVQINLSGTEYAIPYFRVK